MAGNASDIRLTLPARPENVALARHVVGAVAEVLDLRDEVVDDVRLAVTEACTNVVRHAYTQGDGTIDVLVRSREGALQVTVADDGRGLGAGNDSSGPGLGLPLIAALSDDVQIDRGRGRGSRIVMSFLGGPRTAAAAT